jgi:hypothetical protein
MSTTGLLIHILCGLAASVAAGVESAQGPAAGGAGRDLRILSGRTIFFGHQSVGENLLEGVQDLASREGVPLRIQETRGAALLALGHGLIAENGDPLRKLRSFEEALGSGAVADVALMKFCYVDIGSDTDVAGLFARYQETLREMKARHPRTTFVHVTAPLTTVQGGARAIAKRVLGRPPAGLLENARREEFNALMRKAYQGLEPLFDLAREESTGPDGSIEAVTWKGKSVPALHPAYTDDGGHLNQEGRLRAARALVAALAAAPVAGPAQVSPRP